MRKRSVPYTIVRGGVYYLNLRWNNQFIRQSLATKDPMEAFQKVNQLAPVFANPKTCVQTLRQQVFEMGGSSKRLRGNALKLVQSDESSLLLSQGFSLYKREQVLENWGVRTAAQNEASFKQLIEVIGDICNPPTNPKRLFVENSSKIKQRSFLCVNPDIAIVR